MLWSDGSHLDDFLNTGAEIVIVTTAATVTCKNISTSFRSRHFLIREQWLAVSSDEGIFKLSETLSAYRYFSGMECGFDPANNDRLIFASYADSNQRLFDAESENQVIVSRDSYVSSW